MQSLDTQIMGIKGQKMQKSTDILGNVQLVSAKVPMNKSDNH